jgi:hypothetical protein
MLINIFTSKIIKIILISIYLVSFAGCLTPTPEQQKRMCFENINYQIFSLFILMHTGSDASESSESDKLLWAVVGAHMGCESLDDEYIGL